jgi:hypothetical protein
METVAQFLHLVTEFMIVAGMVWQIVLSRRSSGKIDTVITNTNGIQRQLSVGDQAIGEKRGREIEREQALSSPRD